MAGKSHIVSIGGEAHDAEPLELTHQLEEGADSEAYSDESWSEDWSLDEEVRPSAWRGLLLPGLAAGAIAVWTAAFVWTYQAQMLSGASAQQWVQWISSWAMPVALIVGVWLLAMRTSQREQTRFADTAALMAAESAKLEDRLAVVNRELSLAREFIASQSRDLESLGRIAAERLSTNAAELRDLISDNGERIDQISTVSASALDNMSKLRGDLPVIANSARDVSNQIGAAGRTAHGQVDELAGALQRVNEFGQASERQVVAVKDKASDTISYLIEQTDKLGIIADERFGELAKRSEEFRADLDTREVEALAGIRRRADALRDELGESGAKMDEQEAKALTALRGRLAALREESVAISETLRDGEDRAEQAWSDTVERIGGELDRLDELFAERAKRIDFEKAEREDALETHEAAVLAALSARLNDFDEATSARQQALLARADELGAREVALTEKMAALAEEGEHLASFGERAEEALTTALDKLRGSFETGQSTLGETEVAVAGLTDASVRLLELLQATAQHSQVSLPTAIGSAEQRLAELEGKSTELAALISGLTESGRNTAEEIGRGTAQADEAIAKLSEFQAVVEQRYAADAERLARLREELAALDRQGADLSSRIQDDLSKAVMTLETAHANAIASLEQGGAERLSAIADKVGEDSANAIQRAVQERSQAAIRELDEAAAEATARSREAAVQLRDQLARVAELTSNLESRVAHARKRAEEQVDNDFARRVALITESLNSNAIDIAKAMSREVSDTAWDAYLKGDRGIFTRRAVNLLDRDELREIAGLFESDGDFHEHVSRYIHDFEAMLRTLLSTRDGNALAVTMLSSDMGKLYVALAQAIDRLRN